jgi:hypothetical protein
LEIDPLLKIYETYKHEIEFITVYEGKKGEIGDAQKSRYYLQSALQNLPSGYRIGEVGYGSSKGIYVGPVYK